MSLQKVKRFVRHWVYDCVDFFETDALFCFLPAYPAKFYFEKYLPTKGYSIEELNKEEDIAKLVKILYEA